MSKKNKTTEKTAKGAEEQVEIDALEEAVLEEDEAPTLESLQENIEALQAANNVLKDQYVRAKAETENTRRISTQEVAKARKFALEAFAKDLLPVKDSLDQATRVDLSGEANDQLIEQMSEGLALTLKQLEGAFERFNIELVNPEAGDALDPALHQAMTKQPSNDVDVNNIISTIQTGYTLNERLLRPAMVIVSSGAAD